MKKAITIYVILIIGLNIFAQTDTDCINTKLIVAAENLNFRVQPNTELDPIDKLNNFESLTFIEIHRDEQDEKKKHFSNSWIKVKRDLTGEEGFVFGQYIRVESKETAYYRVQEFDNLPKGDWYGIYKDGSAIKVERLTPKLIESDEGDSHFIGDSKHEIIIRSEEGIKEGEIDGVLPDATDYMMVGDLLKIARIGYFEFSLGCTGTVNLGKNGFIRENERLIFQIRGFKRQAQYHYQQNLSNCIEEDGMPGYKIVFAGDLSRDGFPEVIISKEITHGSVLYYFKSNKDGQLRLVSSISSFSDC